MASWSLLAGIMVLVACGTGGSGGAEFDGATCTYDGSGDFDSADEVALEFRNRSAGPASLLTFSIGDDTSVEKMAAAAAETTASALLGSGQMDIPSAHRLDVPAGEVGESQRRMEPGSYAVACLVEADDRLFIAGSITVAAP